MGIFKFFEVISNVGGLITIFGRLISRLGQGGTEILSSPELETVREDMSQDSSSSLNGEEDEKPETEDYR